MGFTKWGTVIFSDLVCKGRLEGSNDKTRLVMSDWQGQVGKVGLSRVEVTKKEELGK